MGTPTCIHWELPPPLLGAPSHVDLGAPRYLMGAPSSQPWELPAKSAGCLGAPTGIPWELPSISRGSSQQILLGAPSKSEWELPCSRKNRWELPPSTRFQWELPQKPPITWELPWTFVGAPSQFLYLSGSSHPILTFDGSSHAATGSTHSTFPDNSSQLPNSVAMGCCTVFVTSPLALHHLSSP